MVLENHCYLKLNHCPLTWIMPLSFYMFGYVLSASLLGVNSYGQDRMWSTWLQKDMWIRLARDWMYGKY